MTLHLEGRDLPVRVGELAYLAVLAAGRAAGNGDATVAAVRPGRPNDSGVSRIGTASGRHATLAFRPSAEIVTAKDFDGDDRSTGSDDPVGCSATRPSADADTSCGECGLEVFPSGSGEAPSDGGSGRVGDGDAEGSGCLFEGCVDWGDDRIGSATITLTARDMVLLAARTQNRDFNGIGFKVETPLIAGSGASYKAYYGLVPA
jgi:hypothetical protein